MKIFTEIKDNIYNKEYYQNIISNKSMKESIKYLARLSLVLAFFVMIVFSFSFPKLIREIKSEVSLFSTNFPEDLNFSIINGNASINRPEPYNIPVPNSWKKSMNDSSLNVDNIITINTTESFNLDKFNEYSTFSLITKNELIVQQDNKQMKIVPLSNFGQVEMNKSWVLKKEAMLMKALPWFMAVLIPLGLMALFMGYFIGTLMLLFFYALFVWFIFKLKKINISYKKSYQVALHASTIVLILGLFSSYIIFLGNPIIKLALIIIIVLLNISHQIEIDKKEILVENKEIIENQEIK